MRNTIIIIGVIVLILLFTIFPAIGTYNGLVSSDQQVKASWSQVENVYQRRMDLINNLVSTVKGEANFEKSTLVEVQEARSKATQVTIDPSKITPENLQQFQQTQGQLGSSLSRLMVSVEKYPELKATQAFQDLMASLEGVENRCTFERQNFNNSVREYNNKVVKFPGNMFASMFGFTVKPYFTEDREAAKAPKVQF